MKAKVSWKKDLQFVGVADSGYPVQLDSNSSPQTGVGPVELVAIALASCTAMDVISILRKKRQVVTSLDVNVQAEREPEYPRVISHAVLEYVLSGHAIQAAAVLSAIELSVTKYCPVHAMLGKVFPIETHFSIYENEPGGRRLIEQGTYSIKNE